MTGTPTRFGEFLRRNASSGALFLAGALLFPAFLFQQDLVIRSLEAVAFFALTGLSGRRIRLVQILAVAAGIVLFNLMIPVGRVLMAPLGLLVTEGALRNGVARATAVVGMIGLSQFSIRADLSLPGILGGLIGRSLMYFERIMAERKRIRRESVLEDIDGLLLSLYHGGPGAAEPAGAVPAAHAARSTAGGLVFLGVLVAAGWALLGYSRIHPGLIWPR
jgi:hypothetical protein